MLDDQILFEMHPESRRYAVLEDSYGTIWLYLTTVDGLRPQSDVWVANSSRSKPSSSRTSPPPAPPTATTDSGTLAIDSSRSEWLLGWSEFGDAVVLFKDGQAVAFLSARAKHGWNKQLKVSCPWGEPWDEAKFHALFG
jgi:hypothetical protein